MGERMKSKEWKKILKGGVRTLKEDEISITKDRIYLSKELGLKFTKISEYCKLYINPEDQEVGLLPSKKSQDSYHVQGRRISNNFNGRCKLGRYKGKKEGEMFIFKVKFKY